MAPVSSDEGARSTAPPTDSEKGTTGAEAGEDVRFSPDQEAVPSPVIFLSTWKLADARYT